MLRVISHQPTRTEVKLAEQINGQVTDRPRWREPRGEAKRFVEMMALWGFESRNSEVDGSGIGLAVTRRRHRVWWSTDTAGVSDCDQGKKPQIEGICNTVP